MGSLVQTFDPYYYPWWTLNYLLALYFLAWFTKFVLGNTSRKLQSLSQEKKKNVVTYVVEIIATTFAFIAQIVGGKQILFHNAAYPTEHEYDLIILSLQTITILYIWELVYRETFGWPLLIHHLITLLFIQLVAVSYATEHVTDYLIFALSMGFYATTEQSSFLALFCYRLDLFSRRIQAYLFWVAAAMAFVIKSAITIGATVHYIVILTTHETPSAMSGSNWGTFWKYCFMLLLAGLFCSRVYACRILFDLGNKLLKPKPSFDDKNRGTSVVERQEGGDEESATVARVVDSSTESSSDDGQEESEITLSRSDQAEEQEVGIGL